MANQNTIGVWSALWNELQGVLGFSGVENPFGVGPVVIDSPLTLYVETTGNDLNPGTSDRPFKTIQAALDSLRGFRIEADVIVQVGIGTFDGFVVRGISIVRRGGTTGTIKVLGTLGAPTLSTGTSTGTATSTSTNVTTDTGQNWVPSEVVGKFLKTSGANYFPIVAATSTSLTALSSGGTAYEIAEPKTIILNTAKQFSAGTANTCIVVSDPSDGFVTLQRLQLLPSGSNSGAAVFMGSGSGGTSFVEVTTTLPTTGATTTAFNLSGPAGCTLNRCVVDVQKASATAFNLVAGQLITGFTYINGGNQTQNCFVSSSGTATTGALGALNATNTFFNNLLSVMAPISVFTSPVYGWAISGCYQNCVTVCNAIRGDVWLQDIHSNQPSFPIASSGNTTFVLVDKNTRVQVNSNVPSGLAVTDLSVNGATSTLAAMRALTPKVFPGTPNVYGSYVYE